MAVLVRPVTSRSDILAARLYPENNQESPASSCFPDYRVSRPCAGYWCQINDRGLTTASSQRLELTLRPDSQGAAAGVIGDTRKGIMLRGNLDMILEKVPETMHACWY